MFPLQIILLLPGIWMTMGNTGPNFVLPQEPSMPLFNISVSGSDRSNFTALPVPFEPLATNFDENMCTVGFNSAFTAVDFPADFKFGTATAAFQVEGAVFEDGRGPSIWDVFSAIPGNIKNGDNATIAADSYHKYLVDVDLMKSLGMQLYRFSISWPRIIPNGTGYVNPLGIQYYNNLIDSLLSNGITPVVTLYHWDLPQSLYLETNGGWINETIKDYFVEYADLAFRSFGDRVKIWTTFNEPGTFCRLGYSSGVHAPGRCSNREICSEGNSSTEPYLAAHNVLRSHAATVDLYRNVYKSTQQGQISITIDSQFFFPASKSEEDFEAANYALQFSYGWFADPVIFGDYPPIMKERVGSRLPQFSPEEQQLLRGSVDFLGTNCYTGSYAFKGEKPPPGMGNPNSDSWVFTSRTSPNGLPIGIPTVASWLYVVPEALYGLVLWISERYNYPPIVITENGVPEPGNATLFSILCDQHRISFYQQYLGQLLKAIEEGANVKGYLAWSLLDNFEWAEGYTQRYGLFYVNFSDPQRERTQKTSSLWWSYFLKNKV